MSDTDITIATVCVAAVIVLIEVWKKRKDDILGRISCAGGFL